MFLFSEIRVYLAHSCRLIDMERTAFVAVTAFNAGIRLDRKVFVVTFRKRVSRSCKVVVFVNKPHVQAGWTGLTMVAVDACCVTTNVRQKYRKWLRSVKMKL